MASDRIESLSGDDIEIDGAPFVQKPMFPHLTQIQPSKTRTNFDSGNFSISPQPSLDKFSIQCSDGKQNIDISPRVTALEKQFCGLKVQEEDEGVQSFESALSLESVGSSCNSTEVLEVDLFEQDLDGDSLIHLAIVGNVPMLASVLIDIAEDVDCLNLQNDLFQTPLHLAIITEHYDIAVQLVKKGADVKRCDKQGNTPLHLACRKGEKEVIKALLETFGENKLARQKYFAMKNCAGITCLHLAAEQKHILIMGYLFAKGADVNMGDAKSGRTILHYAVERRDLETVVLLLTHPDINADCKTYKGETPLVLAFWRNYQEIVKKLKSNGAYFNYDMFSESDDAS